MAFDDPVVWVLIIAAVIFLFGSSKIPQFARALGQARKEFDSGWKGISEEMKSSSATVTGQPTTNTVNLASAQGSSSATVKRKD